MNLFEINNAIEAIKAKYDDPENKASVDTLNDTLDSLEATRNDKLDGLVGWYDSNKSKIDWLEPKIKALMAEKKRLTNLNVHIMSYMTDTIDAAGVKEVKTQNHILRPRNFRASTFIDDEGLVPKEFKKTEKVEKVDKKLLYAELTAGKEVPGAHLEPNRKTTIL